MSEPKPRPGVTGYVVAAIAALIGVTIAIVAGLGAVRSILSVSGSFDRFTAPGGATLTLDEAGSYTVYHEHVSVYQGQTFNRPAGPPPNMVLSVRRTATGEAVPSGPAMGETYSLGNSHGTSVWRFTVDEPGDYDISVQPATAGVGTGAGAADPRYVMAVGHGVLKGIFMGVGGIFCAVAAAGLGLLIAFVLALITFLRRRAPAPVATAA